jgi:hypothetical protein
MRTTLDLDDDILAASREIARRQKKTAGKVISELVRSALTAPSASGEAPAEVLGFRPFPARGAVVTNEVVDRLREEGEY